MTKTLQDGIKAVGGGGWGGVLVSGDWIGGSPVDTLIDKTGCRLGNGSENIGGMFRTRQDSASITHIQLGLCHDETAGTGGLNNTGSCLTVLGLADPAPGESSLPADNLLFVFSLQSHTPARLGLHPYDSIYPSLPPKYSHVGD